MFSLSGRYDGYRELQIEEDGNGHSDVSVGVLDAPQWHLRRGFAMREPSSGGDRSLMAPPLLGVCLSFLPLCDLLSARQTCRGWRLGRAELLVRRSSSLPPVTVTVSPDTVDALCFLDNALSAIGPITELTLTERVTRTCEEERQPGGTSDWAERLHRVSRGFPSTWTLNDAVQQLIAIRRRPSSQSEDSTTSGHQRRVILRHGSESLRRSFPLTKLTLSHRADHLPLTIASLSALCFLLPTLQELHITTGAMPAGSEAAEFDYVKADGHCNVLLRPLSQLQLRVLTLPTWATPSLRAVFDHGDYHCGCNQAASMESELSVDTPLRLTRCGRSLTTLTLNSGCSSCRGFLTTGSMLLCTKLPQLTSLSLVNLIIPASAISMFSLLPNLTSVAFPGNAILTEKLCDGVFPHLPLLTSLNLGNSVLGRNGLDEIGHLVSCCPQLTSLSNVLLWPNLSQALLPLVNLRSLSLRCRYVVSFDEQNLLVPRPFLHNIRKEVRGLSCLSSLASLSIHFLPWTVLGDLWRTPLPALQTLDVHVDFLSYQRSAREWNCRESSESEINHSTSNEETSEGETSTPPNTPMEISIIHPAYATRFQYPHPQLLPSLTRLHYSAPRLRPDIIHLLSFVTSLQQLTLQVYQPLKWRARTRFLKNRPFVDIWKSHMAGLTKAIICLTTAPQLQKHSEHQRYLTLDTVIRVLPRSFTVVQVCRMRLTTGCDHLRVPPYHLVVSLEHTALLSQCPRPYRPPSWTTATVTVTPLLLLCSLMSSSPGPFHIPFSAAAAAL